MRSPRDDSTAVGLALGRIVRSADFERALGLPPCARSRHFAVHYLAGSPSSPRWRGRQRPAVAPQNTSVLLEVPELCASPNVTTLRDLSSRAVHWVGAVVPKRHAPRSVTRSLLKRLIRAAALRQARALQVSLGHGLWVIRLRAPVDRSTYRSAVSDVFRANVWGELTAVLGSAAQRVATG